MLNSMPRRFLIILLCLLLYISASAAEEISAVLKTDADGWKAGGTVIFDGEVRHPGTDLDYAILKAEIKTEPNAEEKGEVAIISVNGVEEDPDWWANEVMLFEGETNGDLLRLSIQWTVPDNAAFDKATMKLYVISDDTILATADCGPVNKWPEIKMHGLTVLQLTAILLAIIAVITGIWFLLRRRKEEPEENTENRKDGRALDTVIILLFFAGVFLTPSMVRVSYIFKAFPSLGAFGQINFPCTLALLLSFFRLKKWTVTDLCFFAAWLLLLIPMCVSNKDLEFRKYALVPFQNLLPVYFIFYRMKPGSREKTIRLFMILFNCFIMLLLAFAIEEKITNKAILKAYTNWLVSENLYAQDLVRFSTESRFFSFWGHPLTNALLFNTFLAINTAWYKSRGKKIYAVMYVPAAMAGVLLSGSKTGITVCFLLLIVICWEHKKWLLVCIPVFAILYFTGAFNSIIRRFSQGSLTTGRVEALGVFFSRLYSKYPFQWLSGYGSNVALISSHPLYPVRAGFEFPLLMAALDHGIIFSAVLMIGSYGYITWRCLKKKQWTIWLCYTLVYAEINTYNGYALRNWDIYIICQFIAMLMLNMLPEGTMVPDGPGKAADQA